MVEGNQMATLMVIFGVGYVAVFSVFILLHLQAYRKRTKLELNELELFDTRNSIQESGLNCGIGVLSICLAVFGGRYSGLAGLPADVHCLDCERNNHGQTTESIGKAC